MADNRMQQLKNLAKAVPGLNQQAQKQAQAAAQTQLQQQLGAAPQGVQAGRAAQQLGAQQAAQQGQIAAGAQQRQQQQLQQLGQAGLQAQQARGAESLQQQQLAAQGRMAERQIRADKELSQAEIASRKRMTSDDIKSAQRVQKVGLDYDDRLSFMSNQQRKDLARIGQDVKQKLFDQRLTFDQDERGRKFTNERQLADYAAANARDEQQFRDRMQMSQQAHQRKIQMMEVAMAKIDRELQREFKKSEAEKNFQHQTQLQHIRNEMAKKIQKDKAKAANNAAMWQAGGTIAGGAVGAVFGGPGGAAIGASIGGGLGTAVGGAVGGGK